MCETDLDGSVDSGNFSVGGYLPLIQKDSNTHRHGLAVYVKEGLPFAWDLSYIFFSLYQSPSSLCTVFYAVSSNIDEVFSINPSADVFVFGYFNVHHKDWLTYSGRTYRADDLK